MAQTLSYATLEQLWTQAGGSPALAPTMAAIAIAESGGNPHSLNTTPPDYSVGLWQINYYNGMRAGRTKEFGSPSALLASPTGQARAAVAIERQQGLAAWSTYTSGAYLRYMNGANYGGTGTSTAGSPPPAGTGGTGTAQQADANPLNNKPPNCLLGFSYSVGYACILTYGGARAIEGALLLTAGGIVAAAGLIILSAYGLKKSGALDQAAAAAAVIPGAGKVAGAAAGASAKLKAGGAA